jgi:hypothetical protein
MDDQLSRPIYMQTEMPLSDPKSRTRVPPHLLVWVSPTVRYRLAMPPDTIVRLRRSLPHVLAGRATSLSLPTAGLIIAALAVPGVRWWVWLITFGMVLLLAIIPVSLQNPRDVGVGGQTKERLPHQGRPDPICEHSVGCPATTQPAREGC